ncbi:Pentatricopeptide repeat-containing protein [Ananas comosus]|uniref:Pentatricopeptide repeat-containing protein n=1 Tax=Ananas comosus TaxID=4615 RepID=A0A199UPE7_ANACO|nr:Pentatricopeptide repeat-containing protein [Ananas comosus]
MPTMPTIRWSDPPSPAQLHRLVRAAPDARRALLAFDAAAAEGAGAAGAARAGSAPTPPPSPSSSPASPPPASSPPPRASSPASPPRPRSSPSSAPSPAPPPLAALRLLRSAPRPLRSPRAYTAALAALVAHRRLPLARALLAEMRAEGVPPTPATRNVLIGALCSRGALDAALRALRRAPAPDACSYGTLIAGLCRHGRVAEARALFREMRGSGVAPTVVTYTTLLHWLGRSGSLDDALDLFDEMRQRGVAPNVITYSSLIDALCKGGRSAKVMELLDQMVKERCLPNAITYSSVVDGLCKEGRLGEATDVFDRMRLQGKKPDAGLYGKLIAGLCDSGRAKEGANYLDEMILSGVSPNRVTWSLHVRINNTVVAGLCAKNELGRAFQVYQSMRTRGISIEPKTFHLLVVCFCNKSDVDKAARVVCEMLGERASLVSRTCGMRHIVMGQKRPFAEASGEIFP